MRHLNFIQVNKCVENFYNGVRPKYCHLIFLSKSRIKTFYGLKGPSVYVGFFLYGHSS